MATKAQHPTSPDLKFLWAGVPETVEHSTVTRETLVFRHNQYKDIKVTFLKIQSTRGATRHQEVDFGTIALSILPDTGGFTWRLIHQRVVAHLQSQNVKVTNLPVWGTPQ